jgi:hypothetical protein
MSLHACKCECASLQCARMHKCVDVHPCMHHCACIHAHVVVNMHACIRGCARMHAYAQKTPAHVQTAFYSEWGFGEPRLGTWDKMRALAGIGLLEADLGQFGKTDDESVMQVPLFAVSADCCRTDPTYKPCKISCNMKMHSAPDESPCWILTKCACCSGWNLCSQSARCCWTFAAKRP